MTFLAQPLPAPHKGQWGAAPYCQPSMPPARNIANVDCRQNGDRVLPDFTDFLGNQRRGSDPRHPIWVVHRYDPQPAKSLPSPLLTAHSPDRYPRRPGPTRPTPGSTLASATRPAYPVGGTNHWSPWLEHQRTFQVRGPQPRSLEWSAGGPHGYLRYSNRNQPQPPATAGHHYADSPLCFS